MHALLTVHACIAGPERRSVGVKVNKMPECTEHEDLCFDMHLLLDEVLQAMPFPGEVPQSHKPEFSVSE